MAGFKHEANPTEKLGRRSVPSSPVRTEGIVRKTWGDRADTTRPFSDTR